MESLGLAKPAGNVILRPFFLRMTEKPRGFVEFNQFTDVKERGSVRDAY